MMPLFPVFAGVAAFAGLFALSRDEEEDYGAVSIWMGGRGTGAGKGVSPWLGGRSSESPYSYKSPSSVVTGWSTNAVYGSSDADSQVLETMGFIDGFFRKTFTRGGRLEKLSNKISEAESKIADAEAMAEGVDDPAKLEKIAYKIARVEQHLDKWRERRDRIDSRGSSPSYGSLNIEEDVLFTVSLLSDQLSAYSKDLRKGLGTSNENELLIPFLATYDSLSQLVEDSMRSSLSPSAKTTIQQKAKGAQSVMAGVPIHPRDAHQIRSAVDESEDIFGAIALLSSDDDIDDDIEDDEIDDEFGYDEDLEVEGDIFGGSGDFDEALAADDMNQIAEAAVSSMF